MFKKMDNPWLIRVLLTLLPLFGMIVGTALAPLLIETVHPDPTGASIDIYAQYHPEYYKTGALVGFCLGLVIAGATLILLAVQAAAAEKKGETEAHSH